ncbi:MAG: 1-(5-phosphoribosyl)-5-[(5-phosphoribosylamino)methylideneamino]imidazole-4-carboxamide isomerase [Chloroflexia bacterium]|nr:1-(5-phosphoribosyl)-5-[(5-phosphoribosylamino)methylideneamino]imidazole-4-carboxamide isomerase [Chloroflexia bacterium]
MIIYPAIDIRGGKAVRLVEGDFDRETTFDADPLDAALRWQEAGAEWIHIVDLDGARTGAGANRAVIERIRASVHCRIQLGGGIRTAGPIQELLDLGIDRVVLGSIAVTDPDVVRDAVSTYDDRIAVGLDARDGKLATSGWETQTDADAFEVAKAMGEAGVQHIIFTDIRRDGTLAGPNVDALQQMVASTHASVIASGGIGAAEHVTGLVDTGVSGVIIGRALYDGRIDLQQLLGTIAHV